ncbi:MAG: tetratricopeptide repeat protein [Spirochaetales bacterium]
MAGASKPCIGRIYLFACLVILTGPALPVAAQTARDHFMSAEEAADAGEFTTAVQRYRDAVSLNEGYRDAWLGLARAYRELDELDQALESVREARRQASRDPSVINLEGDIQLMRGALEEARAAFERVLDIEPNNTRARIGLAELDLADDRLERAIDTYREVLDLDPQSRRALLSLAVLYDERDEREEAATYISLALDYHPRDPMVHELAGDYFLADSDIEQARNHAETAVSLNSDFRRGWDLLARIELADERYSEAVDAASRIIELDDESTRGWYLLGLAERGEGNDDEAVDALERATEVDPDDEVSRLALESVVRASFELDEDIREEVAEYRFDRAGSLAEENLFVQATADYRRGLSLYPLSRDGRYDMAVLHRRRGFTGKHLEELRILESLGYDDQEILDGITTYAGVLADSVSSRWDADQFDQPRDRMSIGLFFRTPPAAGTRPEAPRFAAEYIRHRLLGGETIDVSDDVVAVRSNEEAFSEARDSGVDYYFVVRFTEQDRSIALDAHLRHGSTGNSVAELRALRSGSRRLQRASASISVQVEETLPARGRIIERQGSRVLINLGRVDGIEEEQELIVLREGRFSTASDRVGYEYDENDVVGRITVGRVDDLLLEGRLETEGFFDLVETGDTVLEDREGQVDSIDERPAFSPLYFRIREVQRDSQN